MAKRSVAALPDRVMEDVHWSFTGVPYSSYGDFTNEVRQYHVILKKGDAWQPDQVVIPCPRIAVMYMCWKGEEQIEPVVELASDNGKYFTAGELLFKLHNAVVKQLSEIDHHFFEGLNLSKQSSPGQRPLYHLRQGS